MDLELIIVAVLIIALVFYLFIQKSTIREGFLPILQPGTTRNMSYDIRGDPYIPFHQVSPWYNPEVFPIRNREMVLY